MSSTTDRITGLLACTCLLMAVGGPVRATSDWDDGWQMMREHFCKRPAAERQLDSNKPTAWCYLNHACRSQMREGTAAGIADGAEIFVLAMIANKKQACALTLPEFASRKR